MMNTAEFDALRDHLLQPISSAEPAGQWMRYAPTFAALSRMREEDNPNLPMGDWERPLQKADWSQVAEASIQLLKQDSKDFQVAAWLTDAWIRTDSWQGLCTGLQLINGIAERFWRAAWPALDENDADRRVAPFVWMNTNLPRTIRLHMVLLPVSLQREQPVTLLDWESAPLIDDAKADTNSSDTRPSRRSLRERVRASDSAFLQSVLYQAEQAKAELQRLANFLDAQLREESPSLSKLMAAIDGARQAAVVLLPPEVVASIASTVGNSGGVGSLGTAGSVGSLGAAGNVGAVGTTSTAPVVGEGNTAAPTERLPNQPSNLAPPTTTDQTQNIRHQDPAIERAQVYAALADLAARLKMLEPHSPTPYMIERALALGTMPLPEMIAAINASAGSMDRFFELLGLTPAQK